MPKSEAKNTIDVSFVYCELFFNEESIKKGMVYLIVFACAFFCETLFVYFLVFSLFHKLLLEAPYITVDALDILTSACMDVVRRFLHSNFFF